MDRITITKDLIPYNFDISLTGGVYNIRIDYNQTGDFFTIGIKKDGIDLCVGDKVVYGKPLFGDFSSTDDFPMIDIVPYDESGMSKEVTYDNLGRTVFLTLDNGIVSIQE